MLIARVVGTVTSNDKNPELEGTKLLVVQPVDLGGDPQGREMIAVDRVDAGVGDRVLVCREGGSARLVTGRERIPLQALVIGVVDHVDWLEGHEPTG